ncbi:hypothetical protein SD961_18040 [Erwinia sp. MMLR14_017]|uniref:hypothetical protein n=1 Tax=Erwinia sp. MMLR14_017 TaxID=3093842 RepID=UPI00298F6099|nr:hypothetical protein [Erwinia sp. MMLR14_017]MDW8847762.1 hypothetical protein [Erwinia sp. MMLR14_017]
MNNAIVLRLAMIQRHCAAEKTELEHLLTDCEARAAGVTAFATQNFAPTLLPAHAWVSALQPPLELPHE